MFAHQIPKQRPVDFSESFLYTRDSRLAAALISFEGVELCEQNPIDAFIEGGEKIYVYKFKDSELARSLVKHWHDKNFIEQNPEHPLAYIRAAFHNHERFVDYIKRLPHRVVVRRGKKIFLIPEKQEMPK